MNNKFIVNNNRVSVVNFSDDMIQPKLPVGIYRVSFSPLEGYSLHYQAGRFNVPDVIFGNVHSKVDRILAAYENSPKSIGTLLSGDKGAGKTMMSSVMCNKMIDKGIPVVLVEDCYTGGSFNQFVESLGEIVLFFDEFAKTYARMDEDDERDPQDSLLSLFDGTSSNKKMVILTENRLYNINSFLLDRPSRIRYHYRFGKLDPNTIKEVCNHHGLSQDITREILMLSLQSDSFSYDILNALVSELQTFDLSFKETIRGLNIPQPTADPYQVLEVVSVKSEGEEVDFEMASSDLEEMSFRIKISAVVADKHYNLSPRRVRDSEEQQEHKYIRMSGSDVHNIDEDFIYYNDRGLEVVARIVAKSMDGTEESKK
jgi:hypothetical protein